MKVLVTGATGFLGSFVVQRLLAERSADVTVLLRSSSMPWRLDDCPGLVTMTVCDLMEFDAVRACLRAVRPDCVVHLAWEGVAARDRDDARQDLNVAATQNLVQACAEIGVKVWIGLGSQAEYGPHAARLDETAACTPTTRYGAAKLAACHAAQGLCAAAGIGFAWLRLFSIYGPKDHPDWLIPYVTRTLLRGERPAVTAAAQVWDYLFVDDAAEAVVRVAMSKTARGVFNLGSGRTRVLRSIIEELRDAIDPRLPIGFGELPYRSDRLMHLEADIAHLSEATGWRPVTPMNEGLRQTVEWFRAHG